MRHQDDRIRPLVLELWTKTRIDWGFATDRIAEAFRRERSIGSRERREVAETLYGMIRQARRIDFALEGVKLAGAKRELARYLAYRILDGSLAVEQAAGELRGVDWDAVRGVDDRIARERDPVRRLGLAHSLPDWLAKRLLAQYQDEAGAIAIALNQRAPLTIRANAVKISRDDLAARLRAEAIDSRPTRHAPDGLILESRLNVFSLAAFREGLFEVQDEASQLVTELVAPPPRGLVVDACAGAGGKTLGLAARMANRGRVVALDVDGRKLEELRRRARRAGLSNVQAIEVDAERWPEAVERLRGACDRVLVDAPCSGLGALRRNPEARWRLTEADLARLPETQESIARRASALVAPGGRLVYATCTILEEENERVVERLRARAPSFTPVRVADVWGNARALPLSDATGTYLRTLPDRHDTDGFFAAVLRRETSPER